MNAMHSVGFFIPISNPDAFDVRDVVNYNPGFGGTFYLSHALASALSNEGYRVIIYSVCPYSEGKINPKIIQRRSSAVQDAVRQFDEEFGGVFLLVPRSIADANFPSLKETSIVLWEHCFIQKRVLKQLKKRNEIAQIVYLTDEVRNWHYGDWTYPKSRVIGNFTQHASDPLSKTGEQKKHDVFYTGALYGFKHLDFLLRVWPKVLLKIPDAHLYVIGSAALYNKSFVGGKFHIAHERYERELMYPLLKHHVLDTVSFLGLKNSEEVFHLISSAKVGIVNPVGSTETFCTSAIEFGSVGVPVIGADYGGLRNTIPDGCGIRINSSHGLKKALCTLLKNDSMNNEMGHRYKQYVANNYSFDIFVTKWRLLIDACFQMKGLTVPAKRHLFPRLSIGIKKIYRGGKNAIYRVWHHILRQHALSSTLYDEVSID